MSRSNSDHFFSLNVSHFHTPKGIDQKSLIDSETLTKYLSYVKRIDPKLTKEAEQKILDYYMKMRNVEAEEMITVTPRQLEGLIRMATARARLLLKTKVEEDDAERAIYLLQNMFENAGIDVNTGKVDLGVLQGRPRSEVSKMQLFMDVMQSLEGEHKTPVDEKQLVEELVKTGKYNDEEAKNFIRKMARDSSIYESKPGHYNRV